MGHTEGALALHPVRQSRRVEGTLPVLNGRQGRELGVCTGRLWTLWEGCNQATQDLGEGPTITSKSAVRGQETDPYMGGPMPSADALPQEGRSVNTY